MSDLLKNIEDPLWVWLWVAAIALTAFSVATCMYLGLRRMWRNRTRIKAAQTRNRFEAYLLTQLSADGPPSGFAYKSRHVPAMLGVLLHYFRTLDGAAADRLRTITSHLDLEPYMVRDSQKGTVGRQMAAVQTLSYLQTLSSLSVIHERLIAKNKYVRLTAARCLTRRKAQVYIPDIIHALSAAFPEDSAILTDIVFRFGKPAMPILEGYVETSDNQIVRAACLDALIMMMPPKTGLNLDDLMKSPNAQLRASAVALSQITQHDAKIDLLTAGLQDPAIAVKVRAAKLAMSAKRVDTLTHLYTLTQDPVLWVRYWAMRAIWNCGAQGRKLVSTIGRGDDIPAQMARDVALECASDFGLSQSEAA